MILQRNLLEAAAILSPDSLSYNLADSLEPLSLLADFDLPHDVIVTLAEKVLASNPSLAKSDNTFDESTLFRLESLKHILCGFSVDLMEKLVRSSNDRRALLHSLGRMRLCRNEKIVAALAADVSQKRNFRFSLCPNYLSLSSDILLNALHAWVTSDSQPQ